MAKESELFISSPSEARLCTNEDCKGSAVSALNASIPVLTRHEMNDIENQVVDARCCAARLEGLMGGK
jgi:hypothetical protein